MMKVSELGELKIINIFGQMVDKAQATKRAFKDGLVLGIGDDAAGWRCDSSLQLATVDSLRQGIHFSFDTISWRDLGWKALAVNLSDIAAMGARPLYALISLALPSQIPVEFVDEFFVGLLEMAQGHSVSLIGGDTSSSPEKLFISITLLGEGKKNALVYRHGAQPGDDLYVTGMLGDSLLGLRLAKGQGGRPASAAEAHLYHRHFDPSPRVREGRTLAERGLAKSMIDVSDGLYSDLLHICEESNVGVTVWVERIPLSPAFQSVVSAQKKPGWPWALQGGEDYELLFSAPPEKAAEIMALGREWECGLTCIGQFRPRSEGLVVRDQHGPVDPALLRGYDHFV